MKRLFAVIAILLALLPVSAQEMTVNGDFKHKGNIPAASVPKDNNGNPGARLTFNVAENVKLESDIFLTEPSKEIGGYNVFVSTSNKKKKYVTVTHDKWGKVAIPLTSGGQKLKGNEAYEITINLPQDANYGKAYLMYTVDNVKNCMVLINGQEYHTDNNGQLQVNLPYGDYNYKVVAEGADKGRYFDLDGTVTLKDIPVTKHDRLRSVTGIVYLTTDVPDAIFNLNGKVIKPFTKITMQVGQYTLKGTYGLYGQDKKEISVYVRPENEGVTDVVLNMLGRATILGTKGALIEIKAESGAYSPEHKKATIPHVFNALGYYNLRVSKSGYDGVTTSIHVPVGESITKEIKLRHSIDKYSFFNYIYQQNLSPELEFKSVYFGLMYGQVRRFGWYARFSCAVDEKKDKISENEFVAGCITGGPMARLCHGLYAFAGLGYGSERDKCHGVQIDGGFLIKIRKIDFTLAYTRMQAIVSKDISSDGFFAGIGFTFQLD